MLCKAAYRLTELNAFEASTKRTACDPGSWNNLHTACTAASQPPSQPAQTCKAPQASGMSKSTR